MDLQSGLLSCQVEKLTKTDQASHTVIVRMGHFFRLKLDIHEGSAVSGTLDLTQPGSRCIHAPFVVSKLCLTC